MTFTLKTRAEMRATLIGMPAVKTTNARMAVIVPVLVDAVRPLGGRWQDAVREFDVCVAGSTEDVVEAVVLNFNFRRLQGAMVLIRGWADGNVFRFESIRKHDQLAEIWDSVRGRRAGGDK